MSRTRTTVDPRDKRVVRPQSLTRRQFPCLVVTAACFLSLACSSDPGRDARARTNSSELTRPPSQPVTNPVPAKPAVPPTAVGSNVDEVEKLGWLPGPPALFIRGVVVQSCSPEHCSSRLRIEWTSDGQSPSRIVATTELALPSGATAYGLRRVDRQRAAVTVGNVEQLDETIVTHESCISFKGAGDAQLRLEPCS